MRRACALAAAALSMSACSHSKSVSDSATTPVDVPATDASTTIPPSPTAPTLPPTTVPAALVPVVGHAGCVVTTPPPERNFDPFYTKYCDAGGIPIISSSAVPDEALGHAWNVITNMLLPRPDLLRALVDGGQYFGVIAQSEVTTQMPEYRYLADDPETDWDTRTRGFGGYPFASAAEENLLCYPDDPYRAAESIALHEFAHTIDAGMDFIDSEFDGKLTSAHAAAAAAGLWTNTYALTDALEYWAEGVQSYFNTNTEASPPDGIHNEVDTREELADYDPELFALINETFRGFEWTLTCDNM